MYGVNCVLQSINTIVSSNVYPGVVLFPPPSVLFGTPGHSTNKGKLGVFWEGDVKK